MTIRDRAILAGAMVCGAVSVAPPAAANVTVRVASLNEHDDNDPVAVSVVGYSDPQQAAYVIGQASAAGDLTTGTARVAAFGSGGATPPPGGGDVGGPDAYANLYDMITVSGAGPTVDMIVTLDVDGTLAGTKGNGPQTSGTSSQTASAEFFFAAVSKSVVFVHNNQLNPDTTQNDVYTKTITPPNDPDITVSASSAHIVIHSTVTVGKAVPISVQLGTFNQFTSGFFSNIDFGNTARLSVSVPAGYTWTSASGVLLSNPGAPGLGLPPDGGTGVHGVPGVTGGGGGGGSSGNPSSGDGGLANASPSGSSGCSVGGLGASSAVSSLLFAAIVPLRLRARQRR